MYKRKTVDEYEVYGYYGEYGWEYLLTESTWKQARERKKEYETNEKIPIKIIKRRIKIC